MTQLIMKQHELRMTHWNCRSVKPQRKAGAALKLASLRELSWSSDIIILTETWLKPGREFEIEGFEIIRKDRENKRGGGVAILIRNGLPYECISEICCGDHNTEFLAIKVIGEKHDVIIAACYRPPGKSLPLQEWKDFFKQFIDCGSFVLAGDFNAHHPVWNCEKAKPDGNKLLKVIKYHNCKVHNTKHRSHVGNKKCPASNVDLIITDSNLAGRVKTHQLDKTMGSDHFPIKCVIDFAFRVVV